MKEERRQERGQSWLERSDGIAAAVNNHNIFDCRFSFNYRMCLVASSAFGVFAPFSLKAIKLKGKNGKNPFKSRFIVRLISGCVVVGGTDGLL